MRASRAFVGIAAASLAEVDNQVTVPQLRVLVMVSTQGPLNLNAVAAGLDVNPSNASRTCDRLIRAGLLDRRESTADRRNITLTLTPAGKSLVDSVTRRRRTAIRRILSRMHAADRDALATAMDTFAALAGEPPLDDLNSILWPAVR